MLAAWMDHDRSRIAATSRQPEAAEPFDSKTQIIAKTLNDLVRRLVSIDLKDAYLSVPIEEVRGQEVSTVHMEERVNEFQCLPFGLSSAPRVFTKLLKLVRAIL